MIDKNLMTKLQYLSNTRFYLNKNMIVCTENLQDLFLFLSQNGT